MFIEQRQVGQMAVFAYLVGDEESGEALVIDPAADTDGIIAAAEKRKVKIKYIVNTHGHVDHIGGNVDMKEKTGAAIIIHEEDADMLVSTPAAMLRMFGAKQSPPADRTVQDGDFIDRRRDQAPGHPHPGSFPGEHGPAAGRLRLHRRHAVRGGRGQDRPARRFRRGHVRFHPEKIFTLPDETVVLPGHNYGSMPTSTIGHEKKYNPFLR